MKRISPKIALNHPFFKLHQENYIFSLFKKSNSELICKKAEWFLEDEKTLNISQKISKYM